MDVPADRSRPTSAPPVHPSLGEAVRSPRRRRPTGAAPPLPYRLQTSGIGWLVAAVVLVGLTLAVFARGLRGPAVVVTVVDDAVVRWLAGLVGPGLVAPLRGLVRISSWWMLWTLMYVLVLALLVLRRWRHLIVWLVVAQLGSFLTLGLATIARRPRPFGVDLRSSWGGWAMPSVQAAFLTAGLMAVLYTLVPDGRGRNLGKWLVVGLITMVALARMALGVDAPSDLLVGVALGVTIPLLLFRRFTPNEAYPVVYRRGRSAHLDVGGARGEAIRRALADQLGLIVEEVKPFGLAGSAGSTPLRITIKGDPPRQLFGKLYAQSHLRSDRWYKLGRELLYGRLEDEKPFNTVRRLVQQEDYALHKLHAAGLPSPAPFGFVELTPEREYLLVTEFFDGAVELGEAQVDDQLINDGLGIIRKLWDAGLAHRDIKPANLLVRDHRLLLIDVAFVEARPSPWRQAVDLANMMLCLALRCGPEQVYRRALQYFTVEEITEGFAAARGLAMPSQLRHLLRAQGRDLHAEFVRLLPRPPRPIRIQRWSARRVGLWALILALVVLAALNSRNIFSTEVAVATPLGVKDVGCGDLEPLWLMAQSVPSASLIPCLQLVPADWTVAEVAVNNGRSVITLDHNRAGGAAMVVRLTASCDLAGATEVTSEQSGARRYLRLDRTSTEFSAIRAYTFPGGCVTQRFRGAGPSAFRLSDTASIEFGFITREQLRQALSQRSHGRLELDP
ncbi:MAG TPA: phosphatase PAP2 family protein [Actinomycetes bacterium]|jgi:tRNA A-37 threonylcarbamoyl transferase component Bud32/membrane-associated phospholipid phosphatase|nr:phosphatase PAP2 family protein [Actinomycetes bacterium]